MLHQRWERRLVELGLPPEADARTVAIQLSATRRRRIRFVPADLPVGGPCGLWLSTSTTDYICYPKSTSSSHQDHIILHEVAHMICDHQGGVVTVDDMLRPLIPHLASKTVHRLLARSAYTRDEEREAELLATLLSLRYSGIAPGAAAPQETHQVARRIGASLPAGTKTQVSRPLGRERFQWS
jgi:hypothetical protein